MDAQHQVVHRRRRQGQLDGLRGAQGNRRRGAAFIGFLRLDIDPRDVIDVRMGVDLLIHSFGATRVTCAPGLVAAGDHEEPAVGREDERDAGALCRASVPGRDEQP